MPIYDIFSHLKGKLLEKQMISTISKLDLLEKLLYQGKTDETLENFKQLKQSNEIARVDLTEIQILEILIMIELGAFKSGLELSEKVIEEARKSEDLISIFNTLLLKIRLLDELGELNECLELLNIAEELLQTFTDNLTNFVRRKESNLNYLKGRVFRKKADYDLALDFTQKALIIKKEIGNQYERAECLILMGVIHSTKGEFQSGIEYSQEALSIFVELDNKKSTAKILNNLGMNHWRIGNLSDALGFFRKSLSLSEELGITSLIAITLLNIGLISMNQGKLIPALKSFRKSLGIFKGLGQKYHEALCLNNIGIIFHTRGELKQALEYYQESIMLFQEMGNKRDLAMCHNNIGEVFNSMGEYKEALEQIKKSLSLFQEIGINLDISLPLLNLVALTIYTESPEETQSYLQQLQEISEKEEHRLTSQRYRLAKALTLKNSKRAKTKIRSSEILEKIIKEETIEYGLTVQAMFELSELLIDELRVYGEEEVFQEVKELIQSLDDLAQKQQSSFLLIDALILQAKLSMVEGDLNASQDYLDQAETITKERRIPQLTKKVLKEQTHLKNQYEKWESLIQTNAPFGIRLEQAQLFEHIKEAKKAKQQWGS